MTIKKVSYDRDKHKVAIAYSKDTASGEVEEVTLETTDEPNSEFKTAFHAMAAYVPDIIAGDRKWGVGINVTGVVISYSKGERFGFVIVCKKELVTSNSPFCFNTPHMTFEDSPSFLGLPLFVDAINELQAAGVDYVNGKRAQQALEF